MRKTLFLILGLFLLAIISIIVAVTTYKKPSSTIPIPSIPTPSPIVIIRPTGVIPVAQATTIPTPSIPISVAQTNPPDGSTNVEVNKPFTITFNQNIYINDVQITTDPLVGFTLSNQGPSLTVTPTINLLFSTKYLVTVKIHNQSPYTFSFTTVGGTENPNTDNYLIIRNAYLRTSYPDMFLANNVPYENSYFSIVSPNSDTALAQYTFVVTLKGDKTIAKNQFLQWLYSLGLAEQQINSLQITYQ